MPENIDAPAGRRTPALTDELTQLLDSTTLWTDYGIDDNIIVRIAVICQVSVTLI